ncbi:methyltransferase, partial [Burkholderia pseudomallei]
AAASAPARLRAAADRRRPASSPASSPAFRPASNRFRLAAHASSTPHSRHIHATFTPHSRRIHAETRPARR